MVFIIQIPIVYYYYKGNFPIHPIVLMLPIIGILNFSFEKRDFSGLGLRLEKPGKSLLIAFCYAVLSFIGWFFALEYRNAQWPISSPQFWGDIVESFLVSVFIVAVFEELVCRGYIQTRIQASFGFVGVMITSLLFGILHIPSAFIDFHGEFSDVILRFFETTFGGFILGFLYWKSRSVFSTITVHGLRNFVSGIVYIISGVSTQELFVHYPMFLMFWLVVQGLLVMWLCVRIFQTRFPLNDFMSKV